jgi:ABC-type phosphate transport system auxiliary subunit
MNQRPDQQTDDCEQKRAQIEARQAEFEQLWLKMSAGQAEVAARYRELRTELDTLRTEYRRTCGELHEKSSLPPSVLSDWRQ